MIESVQILRSLASDFSVTSVASRPLLAPYAPFVAPAQSVYYQTINANVTSPRFRNPKICLLFPYVQELVRSTYAIFPAFGYLGPTIQRSDTPLCSAAQTTFRVRSASYPIIHRAFISTLESLAN
jgi:hypothetical protein